jgi:hypothetical protein
LDAIWGQIERSRHGEEQRGTTKQTLVEIAVASANVLFWLLSFQSPMTRTHQFLTRRMPRPKKLPSYPNCNTIANCNKCHTMSCYVLLTDCWELLFPALVHI